jgi:hypothetical protein
MFYNFSKLSLLLISLLFVCPDAFGKRTDILILKNGDHITGEIKKLEVGILIFKTDDIETINVKWDKVESIQTENIYEIVLQRGQVYYGSIRPGDRGGTLFIKGFSEETRLYMSSIVKITRIRETFWEILDGYVKLGASYTKANGIGQISFGLSGNYRTRIYYLELTANSNVTATKGDQTSRKQDIFFNYKRFLENRWYWGGILGAEENTELGIQLRTLAGGGIGRYFIQTNINWFNGQAALTFNREWYVDATSATYNIEGLVSGQYQLFIYDHPKVKLESALNIFPGITNFGRIRSNLDVNLDWEIFLDFYWVLSFYYDNKPTGNASRTDYRFETSFKYEL